ncbi:MAG: hypothetical protein QME96_10975 [Myxococcota bacterium]|nr:hypothetical protein [Myxococcota bacterium]
MKHDAGARNFVTLFEDGPGVPPHLYFFFRSHAANSIYWRFKRSE